uniref:Ig-like domain-containing protein n=1 Tax=Amphiprion ocellaris TaxID=80972 RepID=A0AAQ5ZAY1_AMPOC
MKMESFILWRTVPIFLLLPTVQCSESQSQTAVFLPEFALLPQGSFMEDATEDQFLTYRYDDQASRTTRSDEDRDTGWDAWGPWSDCSRTCGGGASYSLRRCLSGGSCDGKNIRYRTCSNTDCPVESGDFRTQQCSAHNDIKYQGVTYEWVPAPYDSSAPCALRCQAEGGSLTVELAPKVLDGTRCRVDAFDICISGVCQEVGCDRQLASGAREDNCGVCSGDGSTCQLVRGQAIPHLTPEQSLKTVLEVPAGSRFLRLNAKGPDMIVIEAVSLQGRKDETNLVSTGSYVIGNTSLDFQRGTDRQTLRTHGPLSSDYIIKMKYGGSKDTLVQFLFYQPIRYQWRETDFFPCSVTCGGGYQLNSAECTDIRSNQILPEHYCNSFPENTKPTPKLKECNMDPCPESWEQGPWTQCSVSCGEGGGWQDRSVLCVEEDTLGLFSQVEEWKCTHSPRPVTRQVCNSFVCPQWVAMEWSQCTVTCGHGLRYRVVLCIDHRGQHIGGCDTSLKPHIKEDCLVPIACQKPRESLPVEAKVPWLKQAHELEYHYTATENPTFVPGPWSPCSTTCGPGKQTREVKCRVLLSFTKTEVDLPEGECVEDRPQVERPCYQGSCTGVTDISSGLQTRGASFIQTEEVYSWDYRGFTACSATCAAGKQTAVVRCVIRKQGEEVEDTLCDLSSRPSVMIRICNPEPCPARWELTAWTGCSASCGVGIQTRSVFCMRLLSIDQQDILTVSEGECRDFKPAILQPCNQVDCPPAWETEPWQQVLTFSFVSSLQCSQSCGGGVQVRKVYCKQLLSTGAYRRLEDRICSGVKPDTNRDCNNIDCYEEGVKQCPVLMGIHRIYIQTRKEKRLHLTVGGHAFLLPNTSLVIKCPVRRFPKVYRSWLKDGSPLPSSKHHLITKSGSLKIHQVRTQDIGVYKCVAGPASDIFTLQLIGSTSRSTGTLSAASLGPYWREMSPRCHGHYSVLVSLSGINVHFHLPCFYLIGSVDRLPNWSEYSSSEMVVNRPLIIRQQQILPLTFQKNINISIGHNALLTYDTRSLTIRCPTEGFPPAKISWTKDGALLQFLIVLSALHLSGIPQPSVTWYWKNRPLDASAVSLPSGSLWIRNVSLHNQGTYSCTATNAIGESTASIVLQVYVPDHKSPVHWNYNNQTLRDVSGPAHAQDPVPGQSTSINKFGWRFGGWTTCSASCGNRGTRLWRIRCVTLDGKDVQHAMCQHIPKPITSPVPCNRQDCPPRWSVSQWSKCSVSCGGGWKQRQVSCEHLDARGAVRTLEEGACERMSRPANTEQCTANNCPIWVTSAWGKCSGMCADPTTTVQKRSVICQHANGSHKVNPELLSFRPVSVRNCSSDLCDVQWCPGAWRACTVVCGSGFQSRRVDCIHRRSGRTLADQHCAWLQRPSTWQHCNTSTCGSKYATPRSLCLSSQSNAPTVAGSKILKFTL